MTRKEFKEKVNDLFKNYTVCGTPRYMVPNHRFLTENIYINFSDCDFGVWNWDSKIRYQNKSYYISPLFDDYEIYLDELIIFKELILPKLLSTINQ